MDGGGELVGVVAQSAFDVAQQLSIGDIDEFLGHLAEGRVGRWPQLVHQRLDTGFTIFRDI